MSIERGTAPMTAAAQQFLESCDAVKSIYVESETPNGEQFFAFSYDTEVEVSYVPESLGIRW